MTSRVTTTATVTVALVGTALLALLVALWAASGRAPFHDSAAEQAGFDRVETAIQASGLAVCSVSDVPDGLANQALASRTYLLAEGCPGDTATVVVDRFADAADRDAAARQFEALVRPRGSGVVYTLGDLTVFVRGSSDDAAQDRLDAALRAEGAQ